MSSSDSSPSAVSNQTTENTGSPIPPGKTDWRLQVKTWASLSAKHQHALEMCMTLRRKLFINDGGLDALFAMNNADQVQASMVKMLRDHLMPADRGAVNKMVTLVTGICIISHPKIAGAFKFVAGATRGDAGVMIRMLMAQNYEEFCNAIPAHLRQACECNIAVNPPNGPAELPKPTDRAKRIADAIGNWHSLNASFEAL
jgi:hypothetical protein